MLNFSKGTVGFINTKLTRKFYLEFLEENRQVILERINPLETKISICLLGDAITPKKVFKNVLRIKKVEVNNERRFFKALIEKNNKQEIRHVSELNLDNFVWTNDN